MWIIPSTHPLYSHFAQECLASKEDLSALSVQLEQSLMWRSKPLLLKIWSAKWSKVYWLPHLFSRMLKPSTQNHFAERYTASLADIRASHSPTSASAAAQTTLDIFGHSSKTSLPQLDLFGAGSRMYPTTSISDTEKSDLIWNNLVIALKNRYLTWRLKNSTLPGPTIIQFDSTQE